jgi:hypothetical protein
VVFNVVNPTLNVVSPASGKWVIKEGGVPADAPPMFILAATDDPLKLAPESVALYQDWTAALLISRLGGLVKPWRQDGVNTP